MTFSVPLKQVFILYLFMSLTKLVWERQIAGEGTAHMADIHLIWTIIF